MRLRWSESVGGLVSLALLAVLAGGSWLLASVAEFHSPRDRSGEETNEVASVVEQAVISRTDPTGSPVQRLHAERIEQFNRGGALLYRPSMSQFRPDQAHLRIIAETASVSDDQDTIALKGNVVLTRDAFRDQAPVEVQTAALNYSVKSELAVTEEAVKVTRGKATLHGVGMTANHGSNRFEIVSSTSMLLPPDTTVSNTRGRSRP